jgi:hypothetical protein
MSTNIKEKDSFAVEEYKALIKEKDSFAVEEYKALREEILNKMEKCYTTLGLGVGGITVILGYVFQFHVYELFFVLPILIYANASRSKAETAAVLNAGDYICKIENSIYRQNSNLDRCDNDNVFGHLGWENYLRIEGKRKNYWAHVYTVDIILGSLYLLCGFELLYHHDTLFNNGMFNDDTMLITIPFIIYISIILLWVYEIYNLYRITNAKPKIDFLQKIQKGISRIKKY